MRVDGAQVGVDENAVVDREPRALGDLGVRDDADARDHEVRDEHRAVRELDQAFLDRGDARSGEDLDAFAAVAVDEVLGRLRGHRPLHHLALRLDDGHLVAQFPDHGGEFEADEPSADDDDVEPDLAFEPLPDRVRVGDRAQVQHVLGAGDGQRPWPRARREHQVVVTDRAGTSQHRDPRLAVDPDHPLASDELDAVVVVVRVLSQDQPGEVGLPRQVGLRERGPLVRRGLLVTDERDGAAVSLLAQGHRDLAARLPGPDDDYRLAAHVSSCPARRRR